MEWVLGIDLGANSLGMALLNNSTKEIKYAVSHVFPAGAEPGSASLNEDRRTARGARKLNRKFKERRDMLIKELSNHKMMPNDYNTNDIEPRKYNQTFELFQLRKEALDKQISLKDIGKVLLMLNKKRGFKSNRKVDATEDESKKKDQGKVSARISLIKERMEFFKARTLGEYYFALLLENGKTNINHPKITTEDFIRGEGAYTSRQLVRDEFEKIWDKQKEYYPDILTDQLKLKISDGIIFYQRDLRSAKHLKNKCRLEYKYSNEYVFDRDSLEKQVNKITYKIKNGDTSRISAEVQSKIIKYLKSQAKPIITIGKIKRIIGIDEKERGVIFNNLPKDIIKKKSFLPCTPKSSFEFQEFRIWEQINKIRYTNSHDGTNVPLAIEDKRKLAVELMKVENFPLKGIVKLLDMPKDTKFNNIGEKLIGNVTVARMIKAIGLDSWELLADSAINNITSYSQKQYILWQNLHFAKDNEWLAGNLNFISTKRKVKQIMNISSNTEYKNNWQQKLKFMYKFDEYQIHNLANTILEPDICSMSKKAIKKLLPYLKDGLDPVSASYQVYGEYSSQLNSNSNFDEKEFGLIPQFKANELTNPVVRRSVSEVIRYVNQILKESDVIPDIIRIEMARQLKLDKERRDNLTQDNRSKAAKRELYVEFLNSKGYNFTLNDSRINKFELYLELYHSVAGFESIKDQINEKEFFDFARKAPRELNDKYKLWLECERIDPYEGTSISLKRLIDGDIEIEHIIPYSKCGDNSFTNKTLSSRSFNARKGNKTPLEYFESQPEELRNFKIRVAKFPESKKKRFLADASEVKQIKDSKINDTAYIAVKVKEHFETYLKGIKVEVTNGTITSFLRRELGLDSIIFNSRVVDNKFYNYGKVWAILQDNDKQAILDFVKFPTFNENKDLDEDEYEEMLQLSKPKLQKNQKIISGYIDKNIFNPSKSRDDHRHHALDAIVIALANRKITNNIFAASDGKFKDGTYIPKIKQVVGNRIVFTREAKMELKSVIESELDIILDKNRYGDTDSETGKVTKDDFRKTVSTSISSLLVHYYNKKRKGNPGKYLYNPSGKPLIKFDANGKSVHTRSGGDVARGQLHKDTYYSAFDLKNNIYSKRISIKAINKENVKQIIDPVLAKYFEELLNTDPKSLNKGVVEHPTSSQIKVKKVQVKFFANFMYPLKSQNDTNKYYVDTSNNYCIAIYGDVITRKGSKRDFYVLPFIKKSKIDAQNKKRAQKGLARINYLDEVHSSKPFLYALMQNDFVLPFNQHYDEILCFNKLLSKYEVHIDELTQVEREDLFFRLFRVVKFDQNGNIIIGRHNAANFNADTETPVNLDILSISNGRVLRKNYNTINLVQIQINLLGTKIRLLNKHIYE